MKLSVIIPTLNESQYIARTINSVRERAILGEPYEIIVVDSGSTDGTADIVRKLKVILVKEDSIFTGRAAVLNRGADLATGDVFLFLDADTLPPKGYDEDIRRAIYDKGAVGGAFEFALDGSGFGLRLVEIINRIRYRISHSYYGDQGIFVSAEIFSKIGGYPKRRILEASEFCTSLKKFGRLVLIRELMNTSPRRFNKGGLYKVLFKDIRLWFLNLIGQHVDSYADDYWSENITRADSKTIYEKSSSNKS